MPPSSTQITFDHADAQLTLRNSAAVNKTLLNNLNPGAPNNGVVEFDSVNDGAELKIDGAGLSLGIFGGNTQNKVIFSGIGTLKIIPAIHSKNIELNIKELTLQPQKTNF